MSVLAVLALSLAFGTTGTAQASCAPPAGDHVVLVADTDDADVFLWDTRVDLIDYASGRSRDARWVLAHAALAQAGTPASVIACYAHVLHDRYADSVDDAVGVRVLNGPLRGRFGWVSSRDMRVIRVPI